MRRFVNRLKRVVGRLTTLYKPRLWWLKGREEEKEKEEKEKRVKKLAWVWDAELAKEDGGLHKSRQELKKRTQIQEKEEVKVLYLKHLFVNQRS